MGALIAAEQRRKMAVLGQLTAGIVHDVNNLLTVIMGYSEMLSDHLTAANPQREYVAEIHKAGAQAERLTRQLLAFARQQRTESNMLDLNALIRDSEKMLGRLAGSRVAFITSLAPNLRPVRGDPGQVEQVLTNLVVNARDAMPDGGRLTVTTANVVLDDRARRTDWKPAPPTTVPQAGQSIRPGNYVELSVRDNGVGMSRATMARIFDAYFTTKEPGKGTGLGLATVQAIVVHNGGHIQVESDLGRGTTFKVYWPDGEELPDASDGEAAQSKVVLLVEDEEAIRQLTRHVLEDSGYSVLEAMDGKDALERVEKHAGAIDLLVSDVAMPYLGGRQLAECLRVRFPELKVLFLSGYCMDTFLQQGVVAKEFAYLQKPFTLGALAAKVQEAMGE